MDLLEPLLAARTQAYPTVPWDYSGNGGDGQPIAVDPFIRKTSPGKLAQISAHEHS